MGKTKEKTPITIDDKEYFVEDLTEIQRAMVNHINDLDRKIVNTQFNLDQLNVGRQAFINLLGGSLKESEASQ